MPTPLTEVSTWAPSAVNVIAALVVIERIVRWAIDSFRTRGKPKADIHESRARAARDFAEADEITLRASLTLGEEAMHWTQKMMRAQRVIFDLQSKNERLEAENQRLRERERKQISGGRA
jgi:hypothetical protein